MNGKSRRGVGVDVGPREGRGVHHLNLGELGDLGVDLDALAKSIDLGDTTDGPIARDEAPDIDVEFDIAEPAPRAVEPAPRAAMPPMLAPAPVAPPAAALRSPSSVVQEGIIASQKKRIDELTIESEGLKVQLARRGADHDNVRRRLEKEKEEATRFGVEKLVRSLLPSLDNLQRAVEHSERSEPGQLLDGVRMVLRQFEQALTKSGVETFASKGERFDPSKHQAIGQFVTAEQPPNTIVAEAQRGYFLNGRLLRPAMVTVATLPSSEEDPASGFEEVDVADPPPGEE